ncbi:coatomer WD associated region-domain-containing protein [Chiua virens]|nr:coatomer WD associated region-domain-containing protein [Chiua virens]
MFLFLSFTVIAIIVTNIYNHETSALVEMFELSNVRVRLSSSFRAKTGSSLVRTTLNSVSSTTTHEKVISYIRCLASQRRGHVSLCLSQVGQSRCSSETRTKGIVTIKNRLPLSTKELGTTEIFATNLIHSPNGRFVTVVGDGKYIIYAVLAWRNKSFGNGLSFAWAGDSNT